MNEKTNRRIIIILAVLVLILGASLGYLLGPGRIPSSVSDRMGRLQVALRASQESAQLLVEQLGDASLELVSAQESVSSGLSGLAHGAELNSDNIQQIADSQDASGIIGDSVDGIGGFIDRVEAFNRQGITQATD